MKTVRRRKRKRLTRRLGVSHVILPGAQGHVGKLLRKIADRLPVSESEMATSVEKLWREYLRFLPVEIERNCMVSGQTATFYCPNQQLAIEIVPDRNKQREATSEQETLLTKEGQRVLRLSHREVLKEFGSVCQRILYELQLSSH